MTALLFFNKTNKKDLAISRYIRNIFGFTPKNLELYRTALIHRSASGKDLICGNLNNERLEYLGDAILSAIVADFLFKKYPLHAEGLLTEMRSKIVNRERLNKLSKKIGLDKLVLIDSNTHAKSANGDAFEAILGAIYLDKGYEKTKQILLKKILLTHLDIDSIFLEENNYKSKIISWVQKEHKQIEFKHSEIFDKSSKKMYRADLFINDEFYAEGYGFTIKKAEQAAAEKSWGLLTESSLLS